MINLLKYNQSSERENNHLNNLFALIAINYDVTVLTY